ncbi:MAG: 1-deoxy-D-xylulose-5-phosphate synthase [Candidatus Moranbacteria bacterium]|nr:1-deoxy-D-xylulose-5-phosphate synthase [Candidatus Moranbacteria bacterium]
MKYPILDKVNYPKDLRKLPVEELEILSAEIRQFLIQCVSKTGGHFGSNLGVVELTVALHYVFNTPKDLLVWDVGHQTYPHKILTGRKNQLCTIRQKDGLAPFPKRTESEYDTLGVGHSSTSISAAVGMSIANKDKKNPPQTVVVIGDGALGGGMVFEAMNHAGDVGTDMLIILNDNKMSISPNVGAIDKYLTRLISSQKYLKIRRKGKKILSQSSSRIHKLVQRAEKYAKGMITPGTLFEELGFGYYGPIDGHDTKMLVKVLSNLKKVKGPKLLHIVTQKGKGCEFAESDDFSLHAVAPFDPKTGKSLKKSSSKTFTDVFSQWIIKTAEKDEKLHAITPAMCSGSGLTNFQKEFPERFHDVGIAEQHAVTFSAGLACQSKKPVVAIYSSFLQRAYDQLIHDVAIQNLNVLFAVDRAGLVGPDGATHAGSFDMAFARNIPNLTILAPTTAEECEAMLDWGYEYEGPVIVRYPRDKVISSKKDNFQEIKLGKSEIIRKGKKIVILTFGTVLNNCVSLAEKLNATLVNMRFVKPLDKEMIRGLAKNHKTFLTVEEGAVLGGVGSAVGEFVAQENLNVTVKNIGLPDKFLQHGSREELLVEAGLDERSIKNVLKSLV